MKSIYMGLSSMLILFLLIACEENNNKVRKTRSNDPVTISATKPKADNKSMLAEKKVEHIREEKEHEIRESGILLNIEDAAYPFFILSIEFPTNELTIDFNLNIENISMNIEELNSYKNEYISFLYTSELENILHEILYNGNSLYGDYAPDFNDEWLSINGTLNGAKQETAGDLPALISITNNEGNILYFEEYINTEMLNANLKMVEAYYSVRGVESITHIYSNTNEK